MEETLHTEVKTAPYKWLWVLLAALIAIHMLPVPFMVYTSLADHGPTWLGIDPSWSMMLNYALQSKMTWGRDIIITYGPLGFLSTRNGWSISPIVFVCFDLFLVFNFFLVFRDFILRSSSRIAGFIIVFLLSLVLNPHVLSELAWLLLFFAMYFMHQHFVKRSRFSFVMLSVLCIICFYVKVSAGLVVMILFFLHVFFMLLFKKVHRQEAWKLLALPLSLLLLIALLFHVWLPGYVWGALELISGHNEIMYLNETHKLFQVQLAWLFLIFFLLHAASATYFIIRKEWMQLFYVLACFLFVFLLRKQSILRNDEQHLTEFLCFAPLILLMGHFSDSSSGDIGAGGRNLLRYYDTYMVLAIALLAFGFHAQRKGAAKIFKDRYTVVQEYVRQAGEYDARLCMAGPEKRYIPARILEQIGQHPVDVFPWDSEYLIENKLNYSPRPVFQSYLAFTPYLADANYQAYLKQAPVFLLFDYDAIDNRYPFNEELMVHLFIAKNYAVADTFSSNGRKLLLLKKYPLPKEIRLKKLKEDWLAPGGSMDVIPGSIMKISLHYKPSGRLISFWDKPPEVKIGFMKCSGEWLSFKTSPALLKSGVMAERILYSTDDFANYISRGEGGETLCSFRLEIDPDHFIVPARVEYFAIE